MIDTDFLPDGRENTVDVLDDGVSSLNRRPIRHLGMRFVAVAVGFVDERLGATGQGWDLNGCRFLLFADEQVRIGRRTGCLTAVSTPGPQAWADDLYIFA